MKTSLIYQELPPHEKVETTTRISVSLKLVRYSDEADLQSYQAALWEGWRLPEPLA